MKEGEVVTKDQAWKILTTRYGMGSLGFAIGGITGMVMKRGFWGVVGFAMLGGILGGGVGLLASRNALKEENNEEQEDQK